MEKTALEFAKDNEISTSSEAMPDLSDYMNYRLFLKDFYRFKRSQTKQDLRPYSYGTFSAAANIRSPNYLKMIIEGKRNLSLDMVGKFGKALSFSKLQTEEFKLLVQFTQCTDPGERNLFLKKLSEHRVTDQLKAGEIDRKAWEKVPNWVAWIIYAMIDQESVRFDVKTLKELLRGKAGENEIEHALEILKSSGEVSEDPVTGEIKKARTLTDHADEVPVALVRKLQAQLMYLGLESLYQDAPTDREFGTLTMSLTQAEFEELKFKLRQMRKSMHKDNSTSRMNSKGDRVYQLNIQLFPVSNAMPEVAEKRKQQKGMGLGAMAAGASAFSKPASTVSPAPAPTAGHTGKAEGSTAEKPVKADVGSLVASAASAADLFR